MSSNSYTTYCPSCGNEDSVQACTDTRPYNNVSGECIECGFMYYTKAEQMSLEEVNEIRENSYELEPLKELAKGTYFNNPF